VARAGVPRRSARGFTIIEIVFSIAVIFLILALLLVGIHHAVKFAKGTGDRAAVTALKEAVSHFKQQFGFSPPLVKDGFSPQFGTTGPLAANSPRWPVVYRVSDQNDRMILNGTYELFSNTNLGNLDPRFSIYTLPYYVMGVLGKAETQTPTTDPPIDGVDGLGFCAPKRDGTWERSGRKFQPFYDPRRADAIYNDVTRDMGNAKPGHVELRDSHGVAFRYYRWLPDVVAMNPPPPPPYNFDNLRVPDLVSGRQHDQPDNGPEPRSETRDAEYAIIGAGPNGVFGDEDLLPPTHPQFIPGNVPGLAAKLGLQYDGTPASEEKIRLAAAADNVVEVGR
jgi:type II secretory pathway pseudopilin PulG